MGIKPPDITHPFPTPAMIKRGGRLQVQEQEDGWLVWQPGHAAHLVEKENQFYTCDCVGFKMRGVCSHIAAVRVKQGELNKEELF